VKRSPRVSTGMAATNPDSSTPKTDEAKTAVRRKYFRLWILDFGFWIAAEKVLGSEC